jgi:hypothetical protein
MLDFRSLEGLVVHQFMDFGEGFVGARECCIFFVFKIYKNNIFF